MIRGVLMFLAGFAAGVLGMGYGVASSMQNDPTWWQTRLERLRRGAPGQVEGRTSTQERPVYDPTLYRPGMRSN